MPVAARLMLRNLLRNKLFLFILFEPTGFQTSLTPCWDPEKSKNDGCQWQTKPSAVPYFKIKRTDPVSYKVNTRHKEPHFDVKFKPFLLIYIREKGLFFFLKTLQQYNNASWTRINENDHKQSQF